MNDAHLSIMVGLLLVLAGALLVAKPDLLQRLQMRTYQLFSLGHLRAFVESGRYRRSTVAFGWLTLLVGLFVLAGSIVELIRKL
jgi:hypothetical protein